MQSNEPRFDLENTLSGLNELESNIWDAHVHIWSSHEFSALKECARSFGVTRFMGIAAPEVKKELEKTGETDTIVFACYLPINAFAEHDTQTLLQSLDEAQRLEYPVVKMWFGPRFLDFSGTKKKFSIASESFEPVFTRIEEYDFIVDVHVADPDYWYATKYLDVERYRTKEQAINEFETVLNRHPKMKTISVHFGSLPEPKNLAKLDELLNKYTNLFIDTASTKWIVRELGREPDKSLEFFKSHENRILFATDLSIGWGDNGVSKEYLATRYWTQRLFFETQVRGVELPFKDEDNTTETVINGLNLPKNILKKFYWTNAEKLFSRK
ncbi:MAG: amidohydrolase family protein [Candidatus Hodarchaeales archaeon]